MKILITGIHGFVGSNLVKALKSNHTIYGLDIASPSKEGVIKTFNWKELKEIPAVDVVIHLAGKAHATKDWRNAHEYFDINTGLTKIIYEWYLNSVATKFVFFSSVKAAADQVVGDMLTEDVNPSPVGPYGESKIAAENYIMANQTNSNRPTTHYPLLTKKTYILRPCMIHGPGNKGNLNLLFKVVKSGIPWPLGAFNNHRSFTSIDNLNFILSQFIERDIESGIYNVGDDETLSTNEIIELICKTLNKPIRIWKINTNFIRFISYAGTVLHLPLNEERLKKLTENYVVSNSKLKNALGIDKMPFRAAEGLIKTIKSFKI
ncbi:MAG TPA: NAD-dependent epimerase/dehydratase family protein [Paludibacter sp.]|nr:NAD-dependent epimerase/dehydratase family protein [Paludibacter sp.]